MRCMIPYRGVAALLISLLCGSFASKANAEAGIGGVRGAQDSAQVNLLLVDEVCVEVPRDLRLYR